MTLRTLNALCHLGRRFLRDERGTTAIEYGLICSLIFLTVVGAITQVADNLMTNFWAPTQAAFQ